MLDIAVRVSRSYAAYVKRPWLKQVIKETMAMEGVASAELSLVITGDRRIRQINREYRRKDAPTDVIAFALTERTGDEFIAPPDDVRHLGEVVVSCPRAAAQAEERGHSTQRELAILIVHGILHLLGYDHEKPAEARKMGARERSILARLEAQQLC